MRRFMQRFSASQRGATAVEYALIAAAIAAVIIVTVVTLGQQVAALYASAVITP